MLRFLLAISLSSFMELSSLLERLPLVALRFALESDSLMLMASRVQSITFSAKERACLLKTIDSAIETLRRFLILDWRPFKRASINDSSFFRATMLIRVSTRLFSVSFSSPSFSSFSESVAAMVSSFSPSSASKASSSPASSKDSPSIRRLTSSRICGITASTMRFLAVCSANSRNFCASTIASSSRLLVISGIHRSLKTIQNRLVRNLIIC